MKTVIDRLSEPTPKFFRRLRNIGLAVAAAGTAILTAPVALPAALLSVAGYLSATGSVAAAVAQAVTGEEK